MHKKIKTIYFCEFLLTLSLIILSATEFIKATSFGIRALHLMLIVLESVCLIIGIIMKFERIEKENKRKENNE